AATLQAAAATPTHRSLQLLLRYEERAGSTAAPLGGLWGTGAGALSGTVFFDADANGRREAAEAGVPGVTVILDRRYVTRTDAQGRYEFPFVAAGPHLVEVSPDNVPLPWSPTLRDPVKATVLVRQTARQDFAVQRER
ncbi:MAG: SdrD B-like domain-containing protein, partial [Polaromonas sp.]